MSSTLPGFIAPNSPSIRPRRRTTTSPSIGPDCESGKDYCRSSKPSEIII
jgi:hypothetical protein